MRENKNLFHIMFILLVGALTGFAGAGEYTVKYLNGVVEIKKAGQVDWQLATLNLNIADGDSIRTKEESLVELQDAQGNSLKIGEVQTVLVGLKLSGQALIKEEVKQETFFSRLRKLTGSQAEFRVTSPTAVAAIRGKASEGFGFTDLNGDGIDDNLIDEDRGGLSSASPVVDESQLVDSYDRDIRGRHGLHNDVRPNHWDNIRCQDPERCLPLP